MKSIMINPADSSPFPGPGFLSTPAALALLLLWTFSGCSTFRTFQIESRPPKQQVAIDGKADDWAGRLFVVEGQKVSLGILNDGDSLYICLRTDDEAMQRQILRTGLTVWFDPRGGRKKALGIKYPVGLSAHELQMWRGEEPEEAEGPGEPGGNLTDVEIHRQGRAEPEILDIADARGFELKAAATRKNFVYELRIPLAESGPEALGVGVPAGATIGVGFETGKFDLSNLPRRPSGMVGGTGGMPPMNGYGGRGGGGVMQPGRLRPTEPQLPEELKIWATVRLSRGGRPEPAKVQSLSE